MYFTMAHIKCFTVSPLYLSYFFILSVSGDSPVFEDVAFIKVAVF